MRGLRNNRDINNTYGVRERESKDRGKKIIAVDFDGTLVRNRYPFIENGNEELLEYIREHRNEYIWILWTCRHDEQLGYAVEWLREQGIVFDYINKNVPWKIEEYGDSRKIYADYYIDDKNIDLERLKNGQSARV